MITRKQEHLYKESIIKNGFRVINCKKCGYWHVFPMPTEAELVAYYEDKYYKTLKNNPTMADKISDPDGFYSLQYEDRLRHITKVLPPDLPKTIIDIGAGYGDFLRFMKKKGWEVQGIEPSKIAYRYIKDKTLNIKCCDIDKLPQLKLKPSSVVTLNNVLEHVSDPQKVISIIRQHLLLPRGILSVIVPNDFNILQHLAMKTVLKNNSSKKFYWVTPPDHLNYWSIKTMKKFLERCSLKILHISVDFPIDIFLLMGEDYITYPKMGRKVHLKRVKFEKNLYQTNFLKFKDLLYDSFAKIGIGRDMQILAKIENK